MSLKRCQPCGHPYSYHINGVCIGCKYEAEIALLQAEIERLREAHLDSNVRARRTDSALK